MDFNKDGEWNDEEQKGPAIHTPSNIKDIVIKGYRVEWLNISNPDTNYYAKNHMVATLIFAEIQTIDSKHYRSACISMELGPVNKVVAIVGNEASSTHILYQLESDLDFLD
jgi:hypothetical protein